MSWYEKKERGGSFAFYGMMLLLYLFKIGGRALFSIVLIPVLFWFFIFGREARHASLEYLSRLKKHYPDLALQSNWRYSWNHFLQYAYTLLDKLQAWSGQIQLNTVQRHGGELMLEKLKQKQGGILLTAHLGNTEAMQALSEFNALLKLNVLVHTKHAQQFNRVLLKQSPLCTIRLLQADDINPAIAADLSRRVAEGEWIVIAADRVPLNSKRTVQVNFLGAPAYLPMGPHILALILACPIVFTTCLKQDDGLHIYFELLTERLDSTRNNRELCFQQSAQDYADTLSRYCKLAPLQWGNFFPFWANSKENSS